VPRAGPETPSARAPVVVRQHEPALSDHETRVLEAELTLRVWHKHSWRGRKWREVTQRLSVCAQATTRRAGDINATQHTRSNDIPEHGVSQCVSRHLAKRAACFSSSPARPMMFKPWEKRSARVRREHGVTGSSMDTFHCGIRRRTSVERRCEALCFTYQLCNWLPHHLVARPRSVVVRVDIGLRLHGSKTQRTRPREGVCR
jgi:hypothetical protein